MAVAAGRTSKNEMAHQNACGWIVRVHWPPIRPPPESAPAKPRQGEVDVTRYVLLLTVAVGLGAAVVLAAGNVLPDVARYLRIRRM